MGAHRVAYRHSYHCSYAGVSKLCPAATAARRHGRGDWRRLSRRASIGAVLSKYVLALRKPERSPLAVLGCPLNAGGGLAAGNPPSGNGCANRQSVSHSSDDHEQVQTVRIDYNVSATNTAWFRFQADTGLQAAYTDPINPVFDAISPQPLYSFAAGYTHVFSQNLVNYFNPGFSWYESLF